MLKKEKIKILLFCFFVSFIAITICSKNSFLYPFNNWVDENAFMTVGKSWLHGLIPYKDLFEHKGPILYFIFMIGYAISNNSFIGIYFFELLSLTICLYFIYKIVKLYLDEKFAYLILPLFASVLVSSEFFVHGGSAEEFLLPFIAYMLFSYLKYFKTEEISNICLFLNGLSAGVVLLIKFNILGFWFIFMGSLFIFFLLKKEIKRAFISCVIFLSGMFLPIFIFILYFYFTHGLSEFINIYFIFNLTGYSENVSIINKILKVFGLIFSQLTRNFLIFNMIYLGGIYFIFSKNFVIKNIYKISLAIMFTFGSFGIYWGCHTFPYYFLVLGAFIIFGLISLFHMISSAVNSNMKIFSIIIVIISLLLLSNSQNLYYMKNSRKDLVQYKFAKIINKKNNPKILNYGFIDGGFYMASGVLPSTKFFQSYNAIVEGMNEELSKKIENKYFDFIIIRSTNDYNPVNDIIKENYGNVYSQKEVLENIEFTYTLYEAKKKR